MRRFGFGAFLALAILVGLVGVVAYNLGVSTGTTDAAIAGGASVIYAPATLTPFAFIIGAFLLILFLAFAARAIAGPRRRWGHHGWGPGAWDAYGQDRGNWDHADVPEPFRPMLERWHRDAHAAAPAGPPSGPSPQGRGGRPAPPPPASQRPSS